MITVSEIIELRKKGDLDRAYIESKNLFESNPEDNNARIELSKSIKALMDRAAKAGDASALSLLLNEYGSLGLEEIGEKELNNKVAWDVRTLLLTWKQTGTYDAAALRRVVEALERIDFVRPQRYYSILLDAMVSLRDPEGRPYEGLVDFAAWWDLKNLLPEDFERMRGHNGRMIPSLAERTYTIIVKALLAGLEEGRLQSEAGSFIYDLDALGEAHPEFQYTLYHKTQLLKALGLIDEAVSSAREFVKRHQNEFWSWSMLGDIVDDDNLKLSCYCRSLMCKTDPGLLVKVRQKAARIMIERGDLTNARKEYDYVLLTYQKKGWQIPADVEEITSQPWFAETQPEFNNFRYYQQHLQPSEDFLYGDVPEKAIIIVKYNPQKGTCSFITEDRERGFFATKKLHEHFADNQIYMARIPSGVDTNGATKVMSLTKIEDVSPYEGIFFRRHRAELNIRPGQTFTFIDDIYIDGTLVQGMQAGDMIDIMAVIFYNIKRASWGWRALTVNIVE